MKANKLIYITISLIIILFSCNKEEEDLFDKSASERAQFSLDKYHKLLASSKNGWALEYYTGGDKIKYGGFMQALLFTEDSVKVKMEFFGKDLAETSGYTVKQNGGIQLSFNDYNSILHYFSTPESYIPEALEADFDYLITSSSEDGEIIYLRGNRYGVETRLVKIKESYEQYFSKMYANYLLSTDIENRITKLAELNVNGKIIPFSLDSRNLVYSSKDSSGAVVGRKTPFIFNNNGMRFYKPVTIDGITFQELKSNSQNNVFKTEDNKVQLYALSYEPFDLITKKWSIKPNTDECSAKFNEVFKTAKDKNTALYSNEILLDKINIGRTNEGEPGIAFASAFKDDNTQGHYVSFITSYLFKNIGELTVKFKHNGSKVDSYTHLKPLVSLIVDNTPFIYELDNKNSPKKIKLTSKKNSNIWFTLNLEPKKENKISEVN